MQLINELTSFTRFDGENMVERITKQLSEIINNKKEALIKQKLTEKGFAHLIPGIENRKFPKICIVKRDDWFYFYADNDTDNGCFIIAIQEPKISQKDGIDNDFTVSCNWHDSNELESLK